MADEAAWCILKGGAAGAVTVQKRAGARMLFRERIPCNAVSIVVGGLSTSCSRVFADCSGLVPMSNGIAQKPYQDGVQKNSLALSIFRHAVRRGHIGAKMRSRLRATHCIAPLSCPLSFLPQEEVADD
ncbi:hypothetical protein PQQ52_33350 [Paraburkholderia sediminicola]|uniref:hypothetical protein n=1 Tax=Paraburkholderia sediminicola TaxID=458836 RepID=UPI0038BD3386